MEIAHQKVIIIGGTSGLGFTTAKALIELGASIVIAGRSEEKLKEAKQKLKSKKVTTFRLDITNENEIPAFFKNIGEFDHLVTPGASTYSGTFIDSKSARSSFDSKFWGQYYAVKYGRSYIKKTGSIVLFSGAYGTRPIENTAIMASINGAVESLCRSFAVDLSPIRVNVISPGYIDTPVWEKIEEKKRQKLFDSMIKQIPIKRLGTSDEIAQAVIFLISNHYTTGTTLFVDGGYTLK